MGDKHFIAADIEIRKRVATCDFCQQDNQDCFNAPNSDKDRDICKNCVERLFNLLKTIPV